MTAMSLHRLPSGLIERQLPGFRRGSRTPREACFEGGPVTRPGNLCGQQWVGSASSRPSDAAVRLRIFRDRRSARANDRSGPGQLSPRHGRRSSSEVDRSFEQKTMTDSNGSGAPARAVEQRSLGPRLTAISAGFRRTAASENSPPRAGLRRCQLYLETRRHRRQIRGARPTVAGTDASDRQLRCHAR